MARPKVHPANRLRAYEACLFCRTSKRRCSGSFPCQNCIRKGQAHSCMPSRRRESFSASRQPNTPDAPSGPVTAIMPSQVLSSTDAQSHASLETSVDQGLASPEAQHKTRPRMLRSLQGERGACVCVCVVTDDFTPKHLSVDMLSSVCGQGCVAILPATTPRYCHPTHRPVTVLTQC